MWGKHGVPDHPTKDFANSMLIDRCSCLCAEHPRWYFLPALFEGLCLTFELKMTECGGELPGHIYRAAMSTFRCLDLACGEGSCHSDLSALNVNVSPLERESFAQTQASPSEKQK